MDFLEHHAYAFEGEKASIVPDLFDFLQNGLGVEIKNNPDFSYQEFETFTIDDGRALQEMHGRRAISDRKFFVIFTRFATIEAQNSLLKIFEEPSEGTHFFLVMPNTQVLIPTLRSRLVIADRGSLGAALGGGLRDKSEEKNGVGDEVKKLAKRFLSADPAERLVLIKDIVEEKDKSKAIGFVTALEEVLATWLGMHADPSGKDVEKNSMTENADALTEILTVKKYLHDRAPSVKLLLEHLCLFVTISKS